jgi:hypothetical protein
MILRILSIISFSALAVYLLSLSAGVFAGPAFRYFYTDPLQGLADWRLAARYQKNVAEGVRENVYFFNFQRDDGKGVVAWRQGKTYGDYTFFYSAFDHKAYLMDFHGGIVHQWRLNTALLPARDSWLHGNSRYPDAVWRAFLQPNGDVIALYCGTEPGKKTSVAKGIFRVDKDSKIIWDHRDRIHHDITVLPDGDILALLENTRRRPYPAAPSLQTPFAEDFLVTLDSQGKEINRISILDIFANSPQRKFLRQLGAKGSLPLPDGDLLHTNTITPVTPAAAARNPSLKAGEYLLSFRNFDMLAAVDLENKRMTWAAYGPWRGQHSPVFLDDGSLMMFDNRGNVNAAGSLSRILDVDTATGEVLWEYDGTDRAPVFSWVSASVDPLPNGNVLVTETAAGRIFEVTRDKQIVWDYRAPQRLRSKQGALFIPNLVGGKRYKREDLPFLDESGPR